MNKQKIIKKIAEVVKQEMNSTGESGHDWSHIYRVWQNAKLIGEKEKVDMFIVELGALLHDIADFKFHGGDETASSKKTRKILTSLGADNNTIKQVELIVDNVSFKGESYKQKYKSLELDVVQDADRLDAMGAIGVARTMTYTGHVGRKIYDPKIKPKLNMNKEEYKNNENTAINHFYEKLLLLKDRMNTKTGKKLAQKRHRFMEKYLNQFFQEWEGKI